MRILLRTSIIALIWTWQCFALSAQPQFQNRTTYLQHIGAYEASLEVETALAGILNNYSGFLSSSRRSQIAEFFSFVLTLNGYTGQELHALNQDGLDVAHAITADNRPLVEQALLADLVVKGVVVSEEWIDDNPNEPLREVKIKVQEILRGSTDTEEIIIRQRNGREYGENPATAAQLDEGKTYLLLLSNSLFRYAIFSNTEDLAESQSPAYASYYSIYRHYEMSGRRILWSGYNNRKTKKAFDEIRWLDAFAD